MWGSPHALVTGSLQRRYDMRHEMLTQRALFCMANRVTLSQHFMAHVVPPLGSLCEIDCYPHRHLVTCALLWIW
jgi:hypothetical protein